MTERLELLTRRLKARTKGDGKAKPGYEQNVAVIKAEISLLQENIAAAERGGVGNEG